MPFVTLPPHQWEDLHKIQRGMLRELANALGPVDRQLAADLQAAVRRMARAAWSRLAIQMELEKVLAKHATRVDATTRRLIESAGEHADQYIERLIRFGVAARTLEPIPASKVAFWTRPGAGTGAAEAVVAFARGRPIGSILNLSRDLHRFYVGQAQEVTQRVLTAIREAQTVEFAARELTSNWPRIRGALRTRGPIGAGARTPQLIEQIRSSIRELGKVTDLDLANLRNYLVRLKPGGRMRLAYAELITDLSGGKAAEKAVEKWGHQKQRYNAERVIATEQQRAFRLAQIERSAKMPGLIGYRWRMNRAKHARFLRSKPGKFSAARAGRTKGGRIGGLAGKHCICEAMDGQIVSVEDYQSEWSAGGHPHCACFFEEVFDRNRMFKAPETAEETEFLDEMGL